MSATPGTWTGAGLAAVALVALAAGGAARPAQAGPWALRLSAATSGYDQRLVWVGRPQLATRSLTPGFTYDSEPGAWNVHLNAEREFDFLDKNALFDSTAAQPGNQRADRADLRVRHDLSEWEFVSVTGSYLRSPDLLDTERGPVVRGTEHQRVGFAAAEEVRFTEGRFERAHRADPSPTSADADVTAWEARALPLRTRRLDLFGGFAQDDFALDGRRALRVDRPGGGFRYRLAPGMRAEVELGQATVFYPDGHTRRRFATGLRLESSTERPTALSFALQFQGDSLASARAELSHVLGIGRAYLRLESLPDVEGSLYHMAVRDRRGVLGVQDTLARATVVGAEASYEHVQPLFMRGVHTTVLRSSVWLVRRIQPWLDARVAYAFLREPALGTEGSPVLRRARMDGELTFHAP